MIEINPIQLLTKPVDLWMNQWLLLTVGKKKDFNMMTVAWGSIGCMWSKPFVQVVVRPQRYTYQFMEKYHSFTLCAFPEKHRKDLNILGTLSGRDGNKLSQTKLTLRNSKEIPTPAYNEANLIMECKTMYYQDMNPKGFLDKTIEKKYAIKDYHRIYFGEILVTFIKK